MADDRSDTRAEPRRAALVTGGSGGIGLEICGVLHVAGYGVTLVGRRPDRVERACRALGRPNRTLGLNLDLTDETQIALAIQRHRARWGRLDVLVNNAGVGAVESVEEITTARLDLQLALNLRAATLLTRETLPDLQSAGREHGKALVVNMASIVATHGRASLGAYSATKAGLVALGEATQAEVDAEGVQVTSICPAFVATEMTAFIGNEVPARAMLRPEDVGRAVSFLLDLSPAARIPSLVIDRSGRAEAIA